MSLINHLKTVRKDISESERKFLFTEVKKLTFMGMSEDKAIRKVIREKIGELQKERKDIEKTIKEAQ